MDNLKPDLAAALDAVLATPRAGTEAHLAPERLVAYHHDRLPAGEAEAVQEHLAACRLCSDLLLELVQFSREEQEEAGAASGLADFEEVVAWRRLSPFLREEGEL